MSVREHFSGQTEYAGELIMNSINVNDKMVLLESKSSTILVLKDDQV